MKPYDPTEDCQLSWDYAIAMLRWRLAIVRLLKARAAQ